MKPSPIRVLHLIDDLLTAGSEKSLAALVRNTKRLDCHCDVVALFAGGPVAEELARHGTSVRILGLTKWNMTPKFVQLVRWIVQGEYHVVQCWRLVSRFIGCPAARLAGVPKVISLWGSPPSRRVPSWAFRERVSAMLSTHLVACSRAVATDMAHYLQLRRRQITVIYSGIELWDDGPLPSREEVRMTLGLAHDDLAIGTVANLNWRKDYPTFLRASKFVLRECPRATFVSIGYGPDHDALGDLAETLGVRQRWKFLGYRDDVRSVLRALDIFALTSRTEGLGVALIEAMWSGLPCVGSRCEGIKEIIHENTTGLFFPVGDHRSLADRLLRLARDRQLRIHLGKNGKLRAEKRFSVQEAVRSTRELYRA